jgi:hypothetical protein
VRPSLLAGKSVFVEWPLDRNLPIAREMLSLSQINGSKTIMGLQGSFSPIIRKMKEIVGSGEIGKVLGSTIMASLGNGDTTERKNVRYFLEREVGGNVVSIHLGHSLEFIASGSYLLPLPKNYSLKLRLVADTNRSNSTSVGRIFLFWQLDGDQEREERYHRSVPR